jgi:transcriptional pleiotropic regulator of transition state genes
MKSAGIVRKVDDMGRITLPMELRRVYGIKIKDPLEMFTDDDTIILKKYEPACIFCGDAKDVIFYKGKNICHQCLNDIKK